MTTETHSKYDIIGDVHGHHEKLTGVLDALGYRTDANGKVSHRDGRMVLFLGDYIDRGPENRKTLKTVRGMVEDGTAIALMGNHEFNAIAYDTPRPGGGWLRRHGKNNKKNMEKTRKEFEGREEEWTDWIEWFKGLPMWIDLGELRAVHACWDDASIALIGKRNLKDPDFLVASATKGTPEYEAVEILLKGPEVPLPDEIFFEDKDGHTRKKTRVRWWDLDDIDGLSLGDISMPPGEIRCGSPASESDLDSVPRYPVDAAPVFVGHYWMPPDAAREPLTTNVVCLDFSAGKGGPLVAYRWEGKPPSEEPNFIL